MRVFGKGMDEVMLVLCTFPDSQKARQIGTLLIERQLAACVNLVPAVESIFRWEGAIETAAEVLGIFKTHGSALPELTAVLQAEHPYDVPEIVTLRPADVNPAYASWVFNSAAPSDR